MRLPDFLLIGAMKSGTTGLFLDICDHPDVYLPDNKEPHGLCDDQVLTEEGQREYAEWFKHARDNQMIGDGSTGYSKLPDRPGVVERAMSVLPDSFRVIYIIREPISRIVSHHYHEYTAGLVGKDIDAVVREHSNYLNYSRYAWQLEPWIEKIGRDRIHVVFFELYKQQRAQEVVRACEFLGLDSQVLPEIDESKVFNSSEGKPVPGRLWKAFRENKLFQKYVRPLISPRLRPGLQKLFMKKAPERPAPPTDETVEWLREQLAEDVSSLASAWGPLPWQDWQSLQDA